MSFFCPGIQPQRVILERFCSYPVNVKFYLLVCDKQSACANQASVRDVISPIGGDGVSSACFESEFVA